MPVTLNSVLQVLIFLADRAADHQAVGPVHVQGLQRGAHLALASARPRGALLLPAVRHQPGGRAEVDGLRHRHAGLQRGGHAAPVSLERTQQWHGLFNPQGLPNVEPQLAFNTAASFTTNTNWQNYAGEQTMSYLTPDGRPGVSPVCLRRDRHRAGSGAGARPRPPQRADLGNFWVDLTRCILYILLPISIVGALVFVSQGMIQNFNPYTVVHTLNGQTQTIAQGPVASMEIIKNLGTNGGGFFNTNSAHPFENPNAFTNLLIMLSVFSIPAGMFYMFGKWVGNTKQGWVLWAASAIIFLVGVGVVMPSEQVGNPLLTSVGANQVVSDTQAGGNMEGKEVRFGITESAMFATMTTDTSCGCVNSFHDSYTPLGGLVLIGDIALGEIVFGGVGAGLYGMLMFAIIAVFIAGLMVGRTPEYLGKKIERKEIMMAALALLILPASILGFSAVASVVPAGVSAPILNPGPHGLTEILYPYTSANGNNGSAFAGLSGNTPFYNWTGGIRYADRPFRLPDPDPGLWRLAGEEAGRASQSGHFPHDGAALRRPVDRGDPDRGRAHLLPGVFAGADCRTIADACREDILR